MYCCNLVHFPFTNQLFTITLEDYEEEIICHYCYISLYSPKFMCFKVILEQCSNISKHTTLATDT